MRNTVIMQTNTYQKTYKRQNRGVSPETAQKISASLKAYNVANPRNPEWCEKISNSLKADTGGYWSKIPPKSEQDGDTFDDVVL